MNLLVTGAFTWKAEELKHLEMLGHQVVFMQQEKDALPCAYEWVEGIIGNGIFLSHPIEKFTTLRYIQLTSAGFDRVPMDYVKAHGIIINNARGIYSIPMAEFAVGGVLALYKQQRFFCQNQQEHTWMKHRGIIELSGRTVGIVGCGSVGTECAKRFRSFGCQVVGVDIVPYQSEWYDRMVNLEMLDSVLMICDVLVLTLPLTEETRGIISKNRLAHMKDGAVLVNIARGAVVDQDGLVETLMNQRISAVLDVFDTEPLEADSALWNLENVIVTPHNSFVGDGNHDRMFAMICDHLMKVEVNR